MLPQKAKNYFIASLVLATISFFIYWMMLRTSYTDEENGTCYSMIWTRVFGMGMVILNAFIIGRNLMFLF